MRPICIVLATATLAVCANVSAADDRKPPGTEGPSKVVREEVEGPFRFPGSKALKVTGKVKVLDAHTLQLDDGTEFELNGGMDAPDLGQNGLIGESIYPCGKEAAEFLTKLIGDQNVTCYQEARRGGKVHGACFVGEKCLDIEMVRNGWALSHQTGMEGWEMIARENKRGLFRGTFVAPERWRKGERLKGEPADATVVEQKAGAALQELGGNIQTERGHVVTLSLGGDKASDAALEHLKRLPHLRALDLGGPGTGPQITDAGLAHLAGLTRLKSLHLAQLPGVTDAGLVHVKGLSLLEDLAITHTKSVNGAGLVHVRGLRRLQSLNFNNTPIADEALVNVKDLTALKSLGLRATKVTDAGLDHLNGLTNLELLNLWGTRVTDDGLTRVAKLPGIKHLLLVNASITADGLKHLEDMPALEDLELRHVKGDDDVALAHVGSLTRLKRLEFHDMRATEAGLEHLGKLKGLEVLLLVASRVGDAEVAHLNRLTALKTLNLWGVPITDEGLAHLKGLTALEELHLSETKITDAGLAHLKGLTNLKILGLSDTRVSDAGLEHLSGLAKLRNLSLLNTRVTDEGVKKLKGTLPQLAVYYR